MKGIKLHKISKRKKYCMVLFIYGIKKILELSAVVGELGRGW